MPFFSDGQDEYFCLAMNPSKVESKFVFRLNGRQSAAVAKLTWPFLLVSLGAFLAMSFLALLESLGLPGNFVDSGWREVLVSAPAAGGTSIGLVQTGGFL